MDGEKKIRNSSEITIEVQEYNPATGEVVTVVPARWWSAGPNGELRERSMLRRSLPVSKR